MLALPDTLTMPQAQAAWLALSQAQARDAAPGTLTVDASALTRFDSSALAVLLACRRQALAQGSGFALRHAPQGLLALAALYGVGELLEDQSPVASA